MIDAFGVSIFVADRRRGGEGGTGKWKGGGERDREEGGKGVIEAKDFKFIMTCLGERLTNEEVIVEEEMLGSRE